MIYLDNAATTGRKPPEVLRAVNLALQHYSANPGRSGHKASQDVSTAVYRVREELSEFFSSDGPETVVFTQNCTHSINTVLKGVLQKGDHAVVSSLEHNAVMRPLYKMGIPYTRARVETDQERTLQNFAESIRPNTRLIFCTAASNVLGTRLPIEKIGKLCRQKGILFGVDAAQTAGVVPINMQRDGIDYLCIAPHKGLYAPMGIGILIARKPIFNTLLEGGTGTESFSEKQPQMLPERLESGTVNVPAIFGIGGGLKFVKAQGVEKIARHETALLQGLYDGLAAMPNVRLYTPRPELETSAPVLSFTVNGFSSGEVADYLSRNSVAVRAGFHCAPTAHRQIGTEEEGTVRVSPAVFNRSYEIDKLLSLLKNIKKKEKI